ncbi:LRRCT domain-containing protein [Caerostris darwini]|uniref:LRRCT domain-containing protein n=1 Tax=Caerostris darwini TaxID=1538125 RepID=A0AAV4VTR7_9ARAC|nr:LRRCT domain-containing protein [Caerostris darwini]
MWIITGVFLTVALFEFSAAVGCPPEVAARPCKCKIENKSVLLICANITDEKVLDGVFRRISGSLLQSPPSVSNNIVRLILNNVSFEGDFPWSQLKPLKKLLLLRITKVPLSNFCVGFKNNVNKNFESLSLRQTRTDSLADACFQEFKELRRISITHNSLTVIKRNWFPTTAKIQVLQFVGNKIERIPEDIFVGMPQLKVFSVSNNKISKLTESMFSKLKHPLISFKIEDNPLNCDCDLRWIPTVIEKFDVYGSCTKPDRLKGKRLGQLTSRDFVCH